MRRVSKNKERGCEGQITKVADFHGVCIWSLKEGQPIDKKTDSHLRILARYWQSLGVLAGAQ